MLTDSLAHFFEDLGAEWVLWLLLAMSVLSVAVMIERWLFLKRHVVDSDAVTRNALEALRGGSSEAAMAVVQGQASMLAVVLKSAFEAYADGVSSVEEVIQAAIARDRIRYDRRLAVLSTIAVNAPFVGLLGTVIGVLNAFGQLASAIEGASRTELVMGSIAEALVATAVGLVTGLLLLLIIGLWAPADFAMHFTVFVMACFVG
ncbi:MAG: MotA/TolQ/ExbB proton channel family protein, partial [Myxococcota bacterium]|nr:MotA/TolQ/ExbB proton channel family protein [Myxococcota bacterium]